MATLEEAREAKLALQNGLKTKFNDLVGQTGLVGRGNNCGVFIELKKEPTAEEVSVLPAVCMLESGVSVPLEYRGAVGKIDALRKTNGLKWEERAPA